MDSCCPTFDYSEQHLWPPQELILCPTYFEERDEFRGSHNNNIHIYCKDRNSKSYLTRIINFPEYSCIELENSSYDMYIPDGANFKDAQYIPKGNTIYWDTMLANELIDRINKKLKEKNYNSPITHYFEWYEDIYNFSKGRKKPYLYIYFHSKKDKKKFKDSCCRFHIFLNREYQYITIKTTEEKVTSIMRLMAKRDLKYNEWFKVVGFKVPFGSDFRVSNYNMIEYFIDYETMIPIDPAETATWFIYPSIVAFDFEVYGHKGVKRFVSSLELKDPIFAISVDYMILEHESTRKKYCLVYGDSDDVEGAEIIRFNSEPDMMVAFSHLITYLNPDVILTYNGNNFDYPYLINRYSQHHIPDHAIPSMGKLMGIPTEIYSENWKSSGAGRNENTFIIAPGITIIDLLTTIKRYYKLRMYSLEYVSNEFLSTKDNKVGKRKITVAEMFDAFATYHSNPTKGNIEGIQKMTRIVDYCIQDSALCIDLYQKLQLWYHLYSLSGAGCVTISDIVLRGEQCRCYANLYNLCFKNGRILSNSKLFDYYYSGGFVGIPIRKVFKFCGTVDFSSLYPSIMQAYNLCYITLIPIWMWPEIPIEYCEVIPVEQDEPTEHYSVSRKNDISEKIKLRNAGYQVNITEEEIVYYNRSFTGTSQILDPENPDERIINDPEDLSNLPEKTKRCYEFRFIKKEILEGFMPKLERCWVAARKIVKNQIKALEKELSTLNEENEILTSRDIEKFVEKQNKLRNEILEVETKTISINVEGGALSKEDAEIQQKNDAKHHKEQVENLEKIKKIGKELEGVEKLLIVMKDDIVYNYRREEILSRIKVIIQDMVVKDKTQNAIKIIANSGYGFTGVGNGMLSGKFIAICVTYIGRKLVNQANDVLVEHFKHYNAVVVYNDTDSSMIGFDIKEEDVVSGKVDLSAIGKEMADVISGRPEIKDKEGNIIQTKMEPVFKAPLVMEFEDFCQIAPIKAKYYLKAKRETDPEKIKKYGQFKRDKDGNIQITKKGVLTAKRGGSVFANKVYEDLSNQVLFLDTIDSALKSLSEHAVGLLNNKYSARDMTKVTELGSDYALEGYYMNVFAKNLSMWGKPVRPGDRIEYIIVKTNNEIATGKEDSVGMKCREIVMWEEQIDKEPIDYQYYMEKGLQTQYDDLFDVGFHDITHNQRFEKVGYQPKFSNCWFVHFKEPVRMISAMLKDYFKATDQEFGNFLWNSFGIQYNPQQFKRNFYIASLIEWELNQIVTFLNQQMAIMETERIIQEQMALTQQNLQMIYI